MKAFTSLLLLCFICIHAHSQNLVNNGSFEDYHTCPDNTSQTAYINGWNPYTYATPDFYHSCAGSASNLPGVPMNYMGTQWPAEGESYIGVINFIPGYTSTVGFSNYREYIHSKITPLVPGSYYEVSMSVSLADDFSLATNGLGVYFYDVGDSVYPISTYVTVLPFTPQISYDSHALITEQNNWVRVTSHFTADSAYDNIVIGSFKDDANISIDTAINGLPYFYSYYYIDSVVIGLAPSIDIDSLPDELCGGELINIGYTANVPSRFTNGNIFNVELSNSSGSFASPIVIGSVTSTVSGTIACTIPTTANGTGYRMRIKSTNEIDSSKDNGIDIRITPPYTVTAIGTTSICEGDSLGLKATDIADASYSWSGPSGFTSNDSNTHINPASINNSGNYIINTDLYSCLASDTVSIMVHPVPIVTASANTPVCLDTLQLNATSTVPSSTYHWVGPHGFNSIQENPIIPSPSILNSGAYIATTTANGCTSFPDTVHVIVFPQPYLGTYASPNDTVCEGTVVTFVTVPMNGVLNPQFQWLKNGSPIPGATMLRLVEPYSTGDSFYCRTFCEDDCGNNRTLYSNKVGMTILPIISNLSVTISSLPSQPLPGNPVTFMATVLGGGYNPQYQWKKNGKDIFGANGAVYSANNLSPFDEIVCCVISNDPCADPTNACSDAAIVNFPTSIHEGYKDRGFIVYPNPSEGSFRLKCEGLEIKSVDVININGQVVYTLRSEIPQLEYSFILPPQLPDGTYTLRAYDGMQYYHNMITLSR